MIALKKYVGASLFLVASLLFAVSAQAAGTYDGITGAVDWADVISGITAIAALIAAVLVVFKGSKMLLRVIRGA